jgi:hypothetical protein
MKFTHLSLSPRRPRASRRRLVAVASALAWAGLCVLPAAAHAHVKWFSEFSYADQPLTLKDAGTPTFWGLVLLSIATIAALVVLERLANRARWYKAIDGWLSQFRGSGVVVMRIGAFATLLLSWQAGVLLAPELTEPAEWIGWLQFVAALLLLFRPTVPAAGLIFIGLYALGVAQFGMFHMLDYPLFLGVGYFLLVSQAKSVRLRESGLPVLYFTLGFCLMWLAAEKVVYPQWALYILQGHPELTLGLDHRFFLVSCALIEFSLGYLLVVCLFERPLALTITLTFFLTSSVFGRREVIGHTIIHTALIVFLIEGPGTQFKPPIKFTQRLWQRLALSVVGFAALLPAVLVPYAQAAQWKYRQTVAHTVGVHQPVEVGDALPTPTVSLEVFKDSESGWNLHVETTNFRFAPELAGRPHMPGEGHAHLYIDGRKAARIYGPWHHIGPLPPGRHELLVTLNANTHGAYTAGGAPIEARATILVAPE